MNSKSHGRTSYRKYDLKEGTSKENVNAASVLIFVVKITYDLTYWPDGNVPSFNNLRGLSLKVYNIVSHHVICRFWIVFLLTVELDWLLWAENKHTFLFSYGNELLRVSKHNIHTTESSWYNNKRRQFVDSPSFSSISWKRAALILMTACIDTLHW